MPYMYHVHVDNNEWVSRGTLPAYLYMYKATENLFQMRMQIGLAGGVHYSFIRFLRCTNCIISKKRKNLTSSNS